MATNLNFANLNSLWGSFTAEALARLGISKVVICPGSRSTPLAFAFATHPELEALPVLDERSAAFFAIGLARASGRPVALLCTSGTAAANFFPAVIEARESKAPLLVLTADRPPELRECASGQTIDQVKLYGGYPRWQFELPLPDARYSLLAHLRQVICHAWERCLWPVPGPVHLNFPFRDPLSPVDDGSCAALSGELVESIARATVRGEFPSAAVMNLEANEFIRALSGSRRPLIIAGNEQGVDPTGYAAAVVQLAQSLGSPVIADGLSPIREYASGLPGMICAYDRIIGFGSFPQTPPDVILRLGALPASKRLRGWLAQCECQHWIVEPGDRNVDPLHSHGVHLRASVQALVSSLSGINRCADDAWANAWLAAEGAARQSLAEELEACEWLFEGKAAWLLSRYLPEETPLFVANSMPVRDIEFFWEPTLRRRRIFFNRGANGIDGTLSSAIGVALGSGRHSVLLTGDLAFLHDTNGLLNTGLLETSLTVILLDNAGGGIFENLPVTRFEPPFEKFFAMPQAVEFDRLASAYGVEYTPVAEWESFVRLIENLPNKRGARLLHLRADRKRDTAFRRRLLTGA